MQYTQEQAAAADAPFPLPPPIVVREAAFAGRERARKAGEYFLTAFLALLSLLAAITFLPLTFATFWMLFSTIARLGEMPYGQDGPFRWAIVTGILAATGIGYLLIEGVARFQMGRTQRHLEENARRVHGLPLPQARWFVHLSGKNLEPSLLPARLENSGWLFFYPDRLEFVGERLLVTVPRDQVSHLEPDPEGNRPGGPGSRWLVLFLRCSDVRERAARLQLQPRDGLSATAQDTKRLEAALEAWLAADSQPRTER